MLWGGHSITFHFHLPLFTHVFTGGNHKDNKVLKMHLQRCMQGENEGCLPRE